MINRVILTGRLTRDPELKYTTNGIANLRFGLAVNRSYANQNGERQADFINCVAWRGQAENMAKFLSKGSLIGVEGRIETGSFQAQDGTTRYTTDVVADNVQFLEPRSATTDQGNGYNGGQGQSFGGNNGDVSFPTQQQFGASPFGGAPSNQSMGNMNSQFNNAPDYSSTLQIHDDDLPF